MSFFENSPELTGPITEQHQAAPAAHPPARGAGSLFERSPELQPDPTRQHRRAPAPARREEKPDGFGYFERSPELDGKAPPEPEPRADVPAAVRELREGNPARALFGEAAFEDVAPDGALPGLDMPEVRQVFQDLGMADGDAKALVELANIDDGTSPEEWRGQALQVIKERCFTPADLDLARRYVARDPRVRQFLNETGLGNHPKVVARAVELARAARARAERF